MLENGMVLEMDRRHRVDLDMIIRKVLIMYMKDCGMSMCQLE